MLLITGYQEGKQWAGFNYLKYKMQLNFEAMRDPYHRRWNDMLATIMRSCFFSVYYHTTLIMNNRFGPWENCAWWRQLQELSADLGNMLEPNCPLLMRLWPDIQMDKYQRDENAFNNLDGEAARKFFLESIHRSKTVSIKGPKIKPSRWFGWMMAHAEWDVEVHTQTLLQVALCIEQGWSSHFLDLWQVMPEIEMHQGELAIREAEADQGGAAAAAPAGAAAAAAGAPASAAGGGAAAAGGPVGGAAVAAAAVPAPAAPAAGAHVSKAAAVLDAKAQ